jgi:hypothetical protein
MLMLNQQFGAAERLLATLDGLGSAATIDMLRQLCVSGAEQLRIASELDSAARAQRVLAQEVQNGIEALLASWERHISRDQEQDAARPAPAAQRGDAPRRRRWRILGAGYAGRHVEDERGSVCGAEPAPPPPATTSTRRCTACVTPSIKAAGRSSTSFTRTAATCRIPN